MPDSLLDLALMGVAGGSSIQTVPTLPADASTTGPIVIAPRYPLVESLPGTVVNDQRWRIAGGTYGTEYLGVSGSWVAQGSVTMGVWRSKGVFHNEGTDWIDCGRPSWLNKLRPSLDSFTVRLIGSHKESGYFASLAMGTTLDRQIMLGCAVDGILSNDFIGGVQVQIPITPNVMLDRVISVNSTAQRYFVNGVFFNALAIGSTLSANKLTIGALSDGGDNLEGDIALVEFYEGANADGSVAGLTLIDRYDFDKWDGSSSGLSENGFPFTVTDGTPFTAKSYAWVPQ